MLGNMKLIHAVDKNNHKTKIYYCFELEENKLSLCLSPNKKSNEYSIISMDIQKTKTPYGYIIDDRRSTAFWDLRFHLFERDYLLISEKSKVMNDMHREIIRLERLVKKVRNKMKFKLVAYHEYHRDPIQGASRSRPLGLDGWQMYSVVVGYFKKDEINEAKEKYLEDNLQEFIDKYSHLSKKYTPRINFELQNMLSSFSKEQIQDLENWLGRECIKTNKGDGIKMTNKEWKELCGWASLQSNRIKIETEVGFESIDLEDLSFCKDGDIITRDGTIATKRTADQIKSIIEPRARASMPSKKRNKIS